MAKKKHVKELESAIVRTDLDEFTRLLDDGADPNALVTPKYGQTLLHKAASRPQMVSALLSRGADPNVRNSTGGTPLGMAIHWKSLETVKAFVAGGADLEFGSNFNETPLIEACASGQLEIARFLLQAGADVNAKSSFRKTAHLLAKESGDSELIALIEEALESNAPPADPNDSATPEQIEALFQAIEAGDVPTVEQLLSEGVHPDVTGPFGNTPLTKIASNGHRELFDVLVRAGGNLHATRGFGQTVLTYSVSNNDCSLHMVETVLAAGTTDADEVDSAFRSACSYGNLAVVRRFVEHGVDVNLDGKHPLYIAVSSNGAETARELIAAGARVDTPVPKKPYDDDKRFANKPLLQLADGNGFTDVAAVLREAGAPEPKPQAAVKRPTKAPPVADTWKRIGKWLNKNAAGWKPMKRKATDNQIAKAEAELGVEFPADLKESYAIHNGMQSCSFFPGRSRCEFYLNPLSEMLSEHRSLCELLKIGDFEGNEHEVDKGIRAVTWDPTWLPFASNGGGDHFCVDLTPAKGGKLGQVILVCFDASHRRKLAPSLKDYLYGFANQLEDGRYTFNGDDLE